METQRWETANFFFDGSANLEHGVFLNNSVELAKINDHIGGTDVPAATQMANFTRRVEIGGIVWNHWFNLLAAANDSSSVSSVLFRGLVLCTCSLDVASLPNELPDWSDNQAPIATAPSTTAEDVDFPTRVHYREFDAISQLAGLVSTPVTNAAARTVQVQRPHNLRLRRYLDDHHGLYFQFYHLWNSPNATGDDIDVEFGCAGTLYYRWRF